MIMAGKHALRSKRAHHAPKRSTLHLLMVAVSIALAVAVSFVRADTLLHFVPAIPGIPSVLVELFDRIVFHEDVIEQVIEERL